ncbi:hypothetical protein [Algibacter lectus]|uniref:Uncharacterized protein n=1 Tax=Algibacter lectus TaxID=221126 RepID=A0A090VF80_9FLAO|nr:hypothetical protein [Algibacter lectus]MWW26380.1 hypothetical protein [Algibacter lectus]TDY60036.1 hypothetical protein DFQ06_3651 [Algibacter lectus]GAL63435.1 hypothetical protein JCM19300_1781 [Algibacter lectus]SFD41387.1 hypothetical protein SAMN04489722_10955 [Algibacter lectus]
MVKVKNPQEFETLGDFQFISFCKYNTTSGLLIRIKKIIEAQGLAIISTQNLSNYKIVSRVTIPFDPYLTSDPLVIILSSSEVKTNENFTIFIIIKDKPLTIRFSRQISYIIL